jgi:membrane protease YdiL (CAAX protease family)
LTLNQFLLYLSEWLGVIAVIWLAQLSQGFKPEPLGFRYPRREGYVSLGLFALVLVFAFFFYPLTNAGYTSVARLADPTGLLWQRLTVAGISALPFILALLVRGQPPRSAGWGRVMLGPSFRLGLALAFLTIFLRGKIFGLINGVSPAELYALLAWVGISLVEESIFRGYLQLRLSAWLGDRWGWLASAGLFVLWQAPRLMANQANLLVSLGLAAVQGLILGWLARKSGHVLAGAIYRVISEWAGYLL